MPIARGTRVATAKMDDAKIRRMRRQYYVEGRPVRALAKEYGLDRRTAWEAVSYQSWIHVLDDFRPEEVHPSRLKPFGKPSRMKCNLLQT